MPRRAISLTIAKNGPSIPYLLHTFMWFLQEAVGKSMIRFKMFIHFNPTDCSNNILTAL